MTPPVLGALRPGRALKDRVIIRTGLLAFVFFAIFFLAFMLAWTKNK
jgi:hypothetical protein